MIRPLIGLVWTLALMGAVVMALLPRRGGEVLPSQELRRRARWTAAAFAVAGAPLLVGAVASLPIGGPPNPLGMIAFVVLCVLTAVAVPVVRALATRARAADDAEQRSAHVQFGPAAAGPPAAHRGLSGQDLPPARW